MRSEAADQTSEVPVGCFNTKQYGMKSCCRAWSNSIHQFTRHTTIPVRSISLILAGIRAGKYHYPTFPCQIDTVVKKIAHAYQGQAHSHTVAGAAQLASSRRVSRLTADKNMSASTKTARF
jgi:hypothetical protein